MKRIKVNTQKDKFNQYYVLVNRAYRIDFPNKTTADKWCKLMQRVLVDSISQLHYQNANLYQIYSTFYFNLDFKTTNGLTQNFQQFEERFNHSFKKYSDGWESLAFTNIFTCFDLAYSSLVILKDYAQRHKLYALNHSVNSLLKANLSLLKSLHQDLNSLDLTEHYKNNIHLKRILKLRKVS